MFLFVSVNYQQPSTPLIADSKTKTQKREENKRILELPSQPIFLNYVSYRKHLLDKMSFFACQKYRMILIR
jgi:hypothetical protein